mgnify:FL=1
MAFSAVKYIGCKTLVRVLGYNISWWNQTQLNDMQLVFFTTVENWSYLFLAGLLDMLHDCYDKQEVVGSHIKCSVMKLHNKRQLTAFRQQACKM